MIPARYKWVVITPWTWVYLVQKPKKCQGGFITKHGKRYVGRNIKLEHRFFAESGQLL